MEDERRPDASTVFSPFALAYERESWSTALDEHALVRI